jgi:hypothetical protein
MKLLTLFIIALGLFFTANAQSYYGSGPVSKLSTELNKPQISHSFDIWQLNDSKGDNKMSLVIEAVKYSAVNNPETLKGIKIQLLPENSITENTIAASQKQFEAFIDESEYSELMVVLKQMILEFKKKEKAQLYNGMTYSTKSGVKLGFIYTEKEKMAYISLQYSQAEIRCEFSHIEKFLTDFRSYIDIAAKDLYLPENTEKLKKAKKSSQEAKDVIIDDI